MRYKKNDPPEDAKRVYKYIQENPGTTAGVIAKALKIKHRNYVWQIIGSFELYDGLTVSEDDKHKFYPFDKQELDDKGWIT